MKNDFYIPVDYEAVSNIQGECKLSEPIQIFI
jgi:hypothetical protein